MWIFKNNSKDLKLPFIQNVKNPLLLSRAQFTNSVGLRALNPIVMIIRMGSLDLITFSDRRRAGELFRLLKLPPLPLHSLIGPTKSLSFESEWTHSIALCLHKRPSLGLTFGQFEHCNDSRHKYGRAGGRWGGGRVGSSIY